jgi:hypothetical protein
VIRLRNTAFLCSRGLPLTGEIKSMVLRKKAEALVRGVVAGARSTTR